MTQSNIETLGLENMQIDTAISMLTIKATNSKPSEQIKYLRLIDFIAKQKRYCINSKLEEEFYTIEQIVEYNCKKLKKNIKILDALAFSTKEELKNAKINNEKLNKYARKEIEKYAELAEMKKLKFDELRENGLFECGILTQNQIETILSVMKSYDNCYEAIVALKKDIHKHDKSVQSEATLV